MAHVRHALAAAALLSLAACGGPSSSPPPPPQAPATAEPAALRKDFLILRELVKQHALQSEAGNEVRVETVERYLRNHLAGLPDKYRNEEEQVLASEARALVGE